MIDTEKPGFKIAMYIFLFSLSVSMIIGGTIAWIGDQLHTNEKISLTYPGTEPGEKITKTFDKPNAMGYIYYFLFGFDLEYTPIKQLIFLTLFLYLMYRAFLGKKLAAAALAGDHSEFVNELIEIWYWIKSWFTWKGFSLFLIYLALIEIAFVTGTHINPISLIKNSVLNIAVGIIFLVMLLNIFKSATAPGGDALKSIGNLVVYGIIIFALGKMDWLGSIVGGAKGALYTAVYGVADWLFGFYGLSPSILSFKFSVTYFYTTFHSKVIGIMIKLILGILIFIFRRKLKKLTKPFFKGGGKLMDDIFGALFSPDDKEDDTGEDDDLLKAYLKEIEDDGSDEALLKLIIATKDPEQREAQMNAFVKRMLLRNNQRALLNLLTKVQEKYGKVENAEEALVALVKKIAKKHDEKRGKK